MTAIEIIEETANFYNLGNRSTSAFRCLYNGPDNKKCAFARMCIDPTSLTEGISVSISGARSLFESMEKLQEALKPEYRGYPLDFYFQLQQLHDNDINWNDTGLSKIGQIAVQKLKDRWNRYILIYKKN